MLKTSEELSHVPKVEEETCIMSGPTEVEFLVVCGANKPEDQWMFGGFVGFTKRH